MIPLIPKWQVMCAWTRVQQIKYINIGNQLKCSGHLWNAWIMWEGEKNEWRTNVKTKGQWIQIFPKKQHWHLQKSPNYVLMQNYNIQYQSSPFLHHTSQSREGNTKKDYFRLTRIAFKEPITLYISCTSCWPPTPDDLHVSTTGEPPEKCAKQPMFADMTGINNFNNKRSRWQSSVMIWEFFII